MSTSPDMARLQDLPQSHQCFVCGIDNPHGLRQRFHHRGGRVTAELELCRQHLGFADRAHGGIVASLLDEAMGWATILRSRRFTYTVELNVRYREPAPVETALRVEAWVERHTRRLSFAAAELRDLTRDALLASASGKFMMTDELETGEIAEQLIYNEGTWRLDEP